MNAVAMHYDPKVSYKNGLILNFMNFNENCINRNEKWKNQTGNGLCISATESFNMLKISSNDC